jgi:hypothetical protein
VDETLRNESGVAGSQRGWATVSLAAVDIDENCFRESNLYIAAAEWEHNTEFGIIFCGGDIALSRGVCSAHFVKRRHDVW